MYDSYGYLSNDQDVIDEITDTALDYQIMSEYTAFVAVSEEVRTDPDTGDPITIVVPVNMPEGVSYEGIFGDDREAGEMQLSYQANRSISASPSVGRGSGAYGSTTNGLVECEESFDIDGHRLLLPC